MFQYGNRQGACHLHSRKEGNRGRETLLSFHKARYRHFGWGLEGDRVEGQENRAYSSSPQHSARRRNSRMTLFLESLYLLTEETNGICLCCAHEVTILYRSHASIRCQGILECSRGESDDATMHGWKENAPCFKMIGFPHCGGNQDVCGADDIVRQNAV